MIFKPGSNNGAFLYEPMQRQPRYWSTRSRNILLPLSGEMVMYHPLTGNFSRPADVVKPALNTTQNTASGLVRRFMAYRASGLNLVVNAIVLWNTVYLSRAVDYVRSQGIIIPEELLSSVAPLPWGHISLTGDYQWNEIDRPLERYRPVRTKRFNPKNFTFP